MDEAAFVNERLFMINIVPLMRNEDFACIFISTPNNEPGNRYTEIVEKQIELSPGKFKDKHNVFRVQEFCEKCQKAERTYCPHFAYMRPHWKDDSFDSMDLAKDFFGRRTDLLRQELYGSSSAYVQVAFESPWVKRLFTKPRVTLSQMPQFVFTYIDPNGAPSRPGGSCMTLLSVVWDRARPVLVAAESLAARTVDERRLLIRTHVQDMQRVFTETDIILVPECNLGKEADALRDDVRGLNFVYVAAEGGTTGVMTTPKRKADYVNQARAHLSTDRLGIWADFRVLEPCAAVRKPDAAGELLEQTRDQLLVFQKRYRFSPTTHEVTSVSYSGKAGGRQDDMVIVFIMACYWTETFWRGSLPVPYELLRNWHR